VRRPDNTLVTVDHNVPTSDRSAFDTVENFIKVRGLYKLNPVEAHSLKPPGFCRLRLGFTTLEPIK
jgi:homoaconitase/3-isopropylmalate dehydratase large subunit